MEEKISVSRLVNGTVIDHIPAGRGFHVLKILKIESSTLSVIASNVDSKKFGKKDLLKIENKHLTSKEINTISLIAPHATISKIENSHIKEKSSVKFPESVEEVLKCPNLSCITNVENEPVTTKFSNLVDQHSLQCHYCNSLINYNEILNNLDI